MDGKEDKTQNKSSEQKEESSKESEMKDGDKVNDNSFKTVTRCDNNTSINSVERTKKRTNKYIY